MKTCFISRFGGFGDVLHASHLPELIKSYYHVDKIDFETNYNGIQILQNNPFIDNLLFVDHTKLTDNRLRKNWDWCQERYDLFFNLIYTIELEYCCNENDSRYYRNDKWRRERLGNISYYDVMTKACGIPEEYYGTRGRMYYDYEDEESASKWAQRLRTKHGVKYLVLCNLSGTSLHKKFVQAKEVCERLLESRKDILIILTGDKHCKDDVFSHERVISWVGLKNFRTVALMTKYVDLTISVETGLPLVAHSWDAFCLQLLTAASPTNHCDGALNSHWIQSPARCSPCHKNPREYWGCPSKDNMPVCVWFNVDEIVEEVNHILIKKF